MQVNDLFDHLRGPYPLDYHGLGDLFAFLFFGVIAVTGTAYIFTHEFTLLALIASLPVALLYRRQ